MPAAQHGPASSPRPFAFSSRSLRIALQRRALRQAAESRRVHTRRGEQRSSPAQSSFLRFPALSTEAMLHPASAELRGRGDKPNSPKSCDPRGDNARCRQMTQQGAGARLAWARPSFPRQCSSAALRNQPARRARRANFMLGNAGNSGAEPDEQSRSPASRHVV